VCVFVVTRKVSTVVDDRRRRVQNCTVVTGQSSLPFVLPQALRGLLGFGLHPVSEWHEHRSGRGGFDPTKEDIATMCTVAAPE